MPNLVENVVTDIQIAAAIRDIILGIPNIIPQSNLSIAINPGDPTITLDNTGRFAKDGLIMFADDQGESTLAIADKTGNIITPDFTGLGYTTPGLQKSHSQGTKVYSNLLVDVPNDMDAMLLHGDPVVIVIAADEEESWLMPRVTQSLFTMHIEYHRVLVRPQNQQMNTNIWAIKQQERARVDLENISETIRKNPKLRTDKGNNAEMLGDKSGSRAIISKSWRKLTADDTLDQFAVAMTIIVRANPKPFLGMPF